MGLTRLGALISRSNVRNDGGEYGIDDVRGMSVEKKFIPTKADMRGVSLRVCRHEMWYNIGGVNKEREANMEDASYHRHDIDDRAWSIIEPLLPGQKGQWGGVAEDNRRFVNAVFWVLRTGAPWRDLPPDYGGWKNTHRRFCRWRDKGCGSGCWRRWWTTRTSSG